MLIFMFKSGIWIEKSWKYLYGPLSLFCHFFWAISRLNCHTCNTNIYQCIDQSALIRSFVGSTEILQQFYCICLCSIAIRDLWLNVSCGCCCFFLSVFVQVLKLLNNWHRCFNQLCVTSLNRMTNITFRHIISFKTMTYIWPLSFSIIMMMPLNQNRLIV